MSSPPIETGEPDIPNQMPPAWSIAGPDTSTTIMSRPTATPSSKTPSTSTSKLTGVLPRATVSPVARSPACSWSAVRIGPQPLCAAAGPPPPSRPASSATATPTRPLHPARMPMTLSSAPPPGAPGRPWHSNDVRRGGKVLPRRPLFGGADGAAGRAARSVMQLGLRLDGDRDPPRFRRHPHRIRQGPRALRGRRRPAAARRDRPHQRLRLVLPTPIPDKGRC